MDDMKAFERQVAGEVIRAAAPARPVDAATVFAAIPTATQSSRWRFQSMLSATKFALAGVIVALFGALLLAGVLPPSSERMAAPAAVGSGEPSSSIEPGPPASPEAALVMYESTARLVVDPGPDPTDQDLADAKGAAVRYAEEAESRAVAQAVIEQLDLDDSAESLLERTLTATDALLLSISVQDEDPHAARAVADAYGDELVRRAQDSLITAEIGDVDDAIARNEASIRTLQNRLRNLQRKSNKTAPDRAEIISLIGQISALQRDIQDLQPNSRAYVRNRLDWFERPTVPEQPAEDEAPDSTGQLNP